MPNESDELLAEIYEQGYLEGGHKMGLRAIHIRGFVCAANARVPIDLGSYVNAAHISAADVPHVVVQKLQAAIDNRDDHGKA